MFDIAFVFRTVAVVYINLGEMADLQDFLQKVGVVKKKKFGFVFHTVLLPCICYYFIDSTR